MKITEENVRIIAKFCFQTVVSRRYGMSTGPIWLDQVDCLGNETALDKCMHFDWSESNCNHTEDVSVRCSYGEFCLIRN